MREDGGLDQAMWWRWYGMVRFSIYFEDGAIGCPWIGWGYERKRGIKLAEILDLSTWKDGIAMFLRWERLQLEEIWA